MPAAAHPDCRVGRSSLGRGVLACEPASGCAGASKLRVLSGAITAVEAAGAEPLERGEDGIGKRRVLVKGDHSAPLDQ